MANSRVIGNWQPDLQVEYPFHPRHVVEAMFRDTLSELGIELDTVEVRLPTAITVSHWHTDGSAVGTKLLVWANHHPTRVQFRDGTQLDVEDGDIIFIDNDEVRHKGPPAELCNRRWFIRATLRGLPKHVS